MPPSRRANATRTHEQTINTALAEILEGLGRTWTMHAEDIGHIFEEGGRPDILIGKSDGWPIVIEAEVGNHRQAEIEAKSRLGKTISSNSHKVHAAVALVYADDLRSHRGQQLREAIRTTLFEYALYSSDQNDQPIRLPTEGWIVGGIKELAILLHRSSIPAWRVEALADVLESGVTRAAGSFSAAHPAGSALGHDVAKLLGQVDDTDGQTRRMAMTVIADAFVFHAALSEAEMIIHDPASRADRRVREPRAFRQQGAFRPTAIIDEWERILEINYWPIFHTASSILQVMPTQLAATILNLLWATAEQLIVGGVTRSHDLTGVVFQRLIADRKFLATYYTMPSGAALLAGLALPISHPPASGKWSDPTAVSSLRIGDFACGTGTLLSTAYQRIGLLHEMHGGNPKELHPVMMQRGLVGLDVLTVAVHLTAAMLAGSYPDTPFAGECLLTMPYGTHQWGVCVGSLDLLDPQTSFEIIQAAAHTAGGRGTAEIRDLMARVGHGHFDLVIMNPPFTRHGAHEGDRTQVHNPAFAAFGADEEEQNRLANRLSRLAARGVAHGHAGLASYFADLADRKLAGDGTLALVLPLSAMSGSSWEKVRTLWRNNYSSIMVVTIAGEGSHLRSFSADTGMAECLVVARKSRVPGENRATFVVLSRQPESSLHGELLALVICEAATAGTVRRLEDGPFGGTRILLGEVVEGEAINCPLPAEGPWPLVGIKDLSLAQTAHQLSFGRLWIEGMPAAHHVSVPVAPLEQIIVRMGPHDLDITGAQVKADRMPQGPFELIPGTAPTMAYPSLWNRDSARERRPHVEPDSHCRVRQIQGRIPAALAERAEARWATATRAHYGRDLQFNSQSTIVAMTDQPTLGGRAWPSVVFDDPRHEVTFALWANSTLGLLCHWWMSNKSQTGRGTTTITSIPAISTLDVRQLSDDQLGVAGEEFEAVKDCRLLPFDQLDEDEARANLDRRLLVNVLGLSATLCDPNGPMERLRRKLAAEPQIRGGKQTRLVFTEDGEESVPR
jgi:hypothetical protein